MFRRIAPAVLSLAIVACGPVEKPATVTVTPVTRYAEGQVLYLNKLVVDAPVKGCDSLRAKYGDKSYENIRYDNLRRILGRFPTKVIFDPGRPYIYHNGMLSYTRESDETPETQRQLAAQLIEFGCEDPEKR